MRIIIRPGVLLAKSGTSNPHQLAMKARVSAPTAAKYVNTPEAVQVVDMAVLAAILTEGFGLSPRQALNLRLGDIFDFVDDGDEK